MSYSGDPASSAKDAVRFHIGDTDVTNEYFNDAEITYMLSNNNNYVFQTAYQACYQLIARFSRYANEAVGGVRVDFSNLSKQFTDLASELKQQMYKDGEPQILAGGIDLAEKEANSTDTELVAPKFTKDMQENNAYLPPQQSRYRL
jgi:hypothetical protein